MEKLERTFLKIRGSIQEVQHPTKIEKAKPENRMEATNNHQEISPQLISTLKEIDFQIKRPTKGPE